MSQRPVYIDVLHNANTERVEIVDKMIALKNINIDVKIDEEQHVKRLNLENTTRSFLRSAGEFAKKLEDVEKINNLTSNIDELVKNHKTTRDDEDDEDDKDDGFKVVRAHGGHRRKTRRNQRRTRRQQKQGQRRGSRRQQKQGQRRGSRRQQKRGGRGTRRQRK